MSETPRTDAAYPNYEEITRLENELAASQRRVEECEKKLELSQMVLDLAAGSTELELASKLKSAELALSETDRMFTKHKQELELRVEELEKALRDLYEKYVVDMHGENVCDCDPSVGMNTCAPCDARAALSPKADK